MSKLNFSIVICAYNCEAGIKDTLRSLGKLDYPKDKYEIILVDDASTDKTAKIAKRFKRVRVVSHSENQGVGAARNTGLAQAKGKWVAYLDDDCTANPEWLNELEVYLKKPKTLGAGGLIASKSTKHILQRYLFRSGYGRPASFDSGKATNVFQRLITYAKDKYTAASGKSKPGKASEVYGANSAFSRQKLNSIKGFNTALRSAEDSDICRRLREKYPDQAIYFNPEAGVRHDFSPSFAAFLGKLFRRQADTLDYYKQQQKTPPIYPFPLVVAAIIAVAGLYSVWTALLAVVLAPLAVYGWWAAFALRNRQLELLIYPYIQLTEETVRLAGLLYAAVIRSVAAYPALASESKPKVSLVEKTKTKTTAHVGPSLSRQQMLLGLKIWWLLYFVAEVWSLPGRGIIAVPFLLIVPGFLLLIALGVRVSRLRMTLYTLGSSIALLLGSGLIANTLVLLSDARLRFDTPLLALVSSVVFAGLLWFAKGKLPEIVALSGLKELWLQIRYPALILALPVLAIMASTYLNQTGSNVFSMVVLAALVCIAGTMVALQGRLTALKSAVLLFGMGLTILVLGATRGDFVPGIDIAREYHLYQAVSTGGQWMPSLVRDAYNACLSVTILPLTISKLFGASDMAILRIVFPMMFALVPLVVYSLARRVSKRPIALLAALLFIAQPAFLSWSSVPLRQMIGILFFAMMLLVAFDQRLRAMARNALFLIFGTGMILSHYSTAYLALGLLALAYGLQLIMHWWLQKQKPWKSSGFRPLIGLPVIILLCSVAFIWYGPVTHASGNITREMRGAWASLRSGSHNPLNIFSSEGHAEQTSILDQFALSPRPEDPAKNWNSYLKKTTDKYEGLYIVPLEKQSSSVAIKPVPLATLPDKAPSAVVAATTGVDHLVRKLVRVFLVIGIVVIVWNCVRRKSATAFDAFTLSAAGILLAVILVPHASLDYDVGRTSQQLLVLLAVPTVAGAYSAARLVLRSEKVRSVVPYAVGGFVVLLLLFVSGLPTQLSGGQKPSMLLNNSGNQYDQLYVHESERSAASWLAHNKDNHSIITAGYFGGNRLLLEGLDRPVTYNDILPWTIDKNSYVFRSYSETMTGQAATYHNGAFLRYPYPDAAVEKGKNTLYTNDNTRIYK